MPNPTLTGLVRHNWTNATIANFHALAAAVAFVHHEVVSSGSGWTEIRNKSGIPGFRTLISGDSASRPDPAQICAPHGYTDGTDGQGQLFIGNAPDDQTMAQVWTSSSPIYAGRWSESWRACAAGFTKFRFLEDEERLLLVVGNDSSQRWAAGSGAWLKPLTDNGSGEADGRVKGMFTSGSLPIESGFWGDMHAFMSSYRFQNANALSFSMCGAWLPWSIATFARVWRFGAYQIDTTDAGLVDMNGDAPLLKVPYRAYDTPFKFVGYGRQLPAMTEGIDNNTINDGSGTLRGYTISGSPVTVQDTLGVMKL